MGEQTSEDVTEHLRLSPDEDLVLTAWQYRMMQRDVAATGGKSLDARRQARDEFRLRALDVITGTQGYRNSQTRELAERIGAHAPVERGRAFELLEEAGPTLTDVVSQRSRALLLLIELYGFEPWPGATWDKNVRADTLDELRASLSPVREEDLDAVSSAYSRSLKALAAKQRRWGRVAVFGAAGIGLGALTAGIAAPAVGALYGSAVLGYSGAVATSAGLAALGGGSLAAGGLGMAGGTALITGAGGAAGMGVVSAGAHLSGLTVGQVAADVVRLEVATELILRDVEGDEEAAKAVVLALRERISALGGQIVELTKRIESLRAERDSAVEGLEEERRLRREQENTLRQLRAQIGTRISRREPDGEVRSLDAEIRQLEEQKQASELVCGFAEDRAEKLDRLV